MKLVSCIKQVPASSNVDVDPDTGVLIRDGNNVKMNPYDLYALEMAFFVKEQYKDTVVHALTMGPPSAKRVLEEAIYMGADEATLLSDRRFAGADVLATSYALSQAIKALDAVDLIVCGKQTTDGDTAQVGPEMAEFLGVPHIPYVVEIQQVTEDSITVVSLYDTHEEVITCKFPCLITVEKGTVVPRLPSYKRQVAMNNITIPMLTLSQLEDQNPSHYGLSGSPTQVEEIFPPSKRDDSISVTGSPEDVAKKLYSILKENKYV